MHRTFPILALAIFTAISAVAAPAHDTRRNIKSVLKAQESAWNRGDIDSFMDGYARSPATTFVSGDTVTRGWQTVRDRYKKKYKTAAAMGRLVFSDLEIKPLTNDTAIVLGRWQLKRAKDNPRGRFTLIFRHQTEGWRVVHDHTSVEDL